MSPFLRLVLVVAAGLLAHTTVFAAPAETEPEFVYRAQGRDTLIGISNRLLLRPQLWIELQKRNKIIEPRRILPGTQIRIPYSWLRTIPDTAVVTAVVGNATYAGKNLVVGQVLPEGAEIATSDEGSVALQLADGSEIVVHQSSQLMLEEMKRVNSVDAAHSNRIRLKSGHTDIRVKPQADVGRFEISTPVAVSAVRGTRFRSSYDVDRESSTNETLEGAVQVSGGGGDVLVPAEFGTRVKKDEAPLPPIALLPPPDLGEVPALNESRLLVVNIKANPQAVAYRVQLSTDEEFKSIVAEKKSSEPVINLGEFKDGEYWLRARAIDSNGIEGKDAIKKLEVHELPAIPSMLSPREDERLSVDHVSLNWSSSGAGFRYRLQIASTDDFLNPLIDKETESTSNGAATESQSISLPAGKYYWRVASISSPSISSKGVAGRWSAPIMYRVVPVAPVCQVAPFKGRQATLRWNASEGYRYHVQVARDARFTENIVDQIVDDPVLTTKKLSSGSYFVRIQLVDGDGATVATSRITSFRVAMPWWVVLVPVIVAIPFL